MQLVARELLERPIVVVPDELEMIPPGNAVRVKACGRYAHLGPTTHDLAHELACPIAIRIEPQAGDVEFDITRGRADLGHKRALLPPELIAHEIRLALEEPGVVGLPVDGLANNVEVRPLEVRHAPDGV